MANDAGLVDLGQRLDAIQRVMQGDMTANAHAVGKGARTEAMAVARSVTGGDAVLSKMGRRGARMSMGYEVEQQGRHTVMVLRPTGAWALTEAGAKPHTIGRGSSRRPGARYVFSPRYAHPVRGPIEHPGTKGQGSIRRSFARIRERASRDFHAVYLQDLAKVMR